jgi:outer membrane protein
MYMNIRKSFVLALCVLSLSAVSAQQITRFAVVYNRDSRNVRDYQAKSDQYKAEIQRMTDEIKNLRQQKVDAAAAQDQAKAALLDSQITTKTNFLLEYSRAKNAELDTLKKKLMTDDDFYSKLYDVIKTTAEEDGCSMVMSLQDNNSILWYSPTVDITDKVIRKMTSDNSAAATTPATTTQ